MRPHDASLPSLVDRFDDRALVEGVNFFPDLRGRRGARSSVHILMFGWREGEIGMQMAALLERKLGEGVEVGDRRQLRLTAVQGGRDMFAYLAARRSPDRRQRPVSAGPRRPLSTTSASTGARTRSAGPTTASSTSSTAHLPGSAAPHRGPFPERRLRRDGARDGRRRSAAQARSSPASAASGRLSADRRQPRAHRSRLDTDRLAGDPGPSPRRRRSGSRSTAPANGST